MAGSNKIGAISFKLEDIHDSASRVELVKIVQCSNCVEIPIRPIFTCENGHVICSTCRNVNPRCGTCMSPATNTRNRVAENIVMSFVFKCLYRNEGCSQLVPWSDIQKHLSECCFRPVSCMESLRENCRGKMIPYSSFLSHLDDSHHIRSVFATDNTTRSIHCDSISQNCSWPLFVMSFGKCIFLQNLCLDNSTLYVWVTLFSDDVTSDGNKYTATIAMKKQQILEARATFPVHSFRKPFQDIKKTGGFLSVHRDQLIALSSDNVKDVASKQIYKYSWILFITINSL